MEYEAAIAYIHATNKFGSKLGLDNITALLELMGNPQENLRFIHVAGTNGKGSTSNFIASVLTAEGYDVGLFTSPYLEVFNERIRINGINIENSDLALCTAIVKTYVEALVSAGHEHPTEFEVVTAIAFEFYKRKKVDFVVLEVGLGGRLDSTNVIKRPMASVITPIAFDHTEYLGDTLEKIAYEKAGIIKEGCLTLTAPQEYDALEAIRKKAYDEAAKLIVVDYDLVTIKNSNHRGSRFDYVFEGEKLSDVEIAMVGGHQVENAVLALTTILALRKYSNLQISNASIFEGLRQAFWAGRFECVSESPLVYIDGAHNLHGAQSLKKTLDEHFEGFEKTAIFGMLRDKDVHGVLELLLPKFSRWILVKPDNPRAMELEEMERQIRAIDPIVQVEIASSYTDALERAARDHNDQKLTVCFGSLYFIGEVRKIIQKRA